MKKILLMTALSVMTFATAQGAFAQSINAGATFNGDAPHSSSDNSVAHGTVSVDEQDNAITLQSTTGTVAGTGKVRIDADAPDIDTQSGAEATMSNNAERMEDRREDRAEVNESMGTEAGTLATRAKGAMGLLNPSEVKQVQSNLRQVGYRVSVDGIWGPRTQGALKSYQKANDLPVTGLFDDNTRTSFEARGSAGGTAGY